MHWVSLAIFLILAANAAQAQPRAPVEDRFPGSPQQLQQTQPAKPAKPAPAAQARKPASSPRAVACDGAFARDSSHVKLATFFGSDNVTWTDVEGPEGSKLKASVLYPQDPARRLEVLWNFEDSRSDTQLIVINGRSTWTAPKGLKLGLPLVALEKLNGKPFRLTGFDHDSGGMVQSWDGGALAELPGGCKVGVRLAPDAKAPPAARSQLSAAKPFVSSDPNMRAVAPKVVEILLGY